jgi:hypothetical protein
MCIDDRREISTFNRNPNGKADLYEPYINENTVSLNDKKYIFSYIPNPHKNLNYTIAELPCHYSDNSIINLDSNGDNVNIINQNNINNKVIQSNIDYYINPSFINTLNENEFVNDIYHQKNY